MGGLPSLFLHPHLACGHLLGLLGLSGDGRAMARSLPIGVVFFQV